jgi:rRNA pseudouridine-1189 N-methylase Emg1 (Nep1/Mra1 family)
MQFYDPTHYTDTEGKPFIADQFTRDFVVKVDAHSNSPIFTEDLKNLAFNLFKAGAIDQEALLDMLEPPMKQLLKDKLKTKMSMSGGGSLPASATEGGPSEPIVG